MITNFLCLTAPWVAGSSPLPSRHIRDSGWLEVWRCPFDCRMRHEVLNLQSIYLLKMYRNPFTHFLIASEAHVKCRCCAILAILPFMTYLIARDKARSAKLVTQMCTVYNSTTTYLLPVYICQFRVRGWRCDMYYLGLTHLIARSAPFRNPTIAY